MNSHYFFSNNEYNGPGSKMSNSNLNFSFLNSRAFGTEISNLTHDQTNVYQNVQEDIKTYKKNNSFIAKNQIKNHNFPKKTFNNSNTSILVEREPKRLEFNKIEIEYENDDKIEECDRVDYALGCYVKEIFNYVRDNEAKFFPKYNYMSTIQKDINEKMRGILIDWLVDVHLKFKLLPETLFLTVNIIDRYLEKNVIVRQKLQLVGVSAMLIACKYEEIYAPEIKDFVYVTDNAYTKEDILYMEGIILGSLDFNLTFTSSFRFMERYAALGNFDEKMVLLARYLLEMSLVEYKMLKYSQSNLASSAIYLVNKIKKKEAWNDVLTRNTKYNESQIRQCAKDLCLLLQNIEKTNLQAVIKKFSSPKYFEVSKIKLETN